jgi:hypothetical protein
MRLCVLTSGLPLRQRLALQVARVWFSDGLLDVARALMYRADYFGVPFCRAGEALMRAPSEWTVGERELMGTFTSSLNRCRF